jgi:UDP-glucose 4-epimerase
MNLHNKSILVTGGAGFIGSHLAERLVQEQPEKVILMDNMFLGKKENIQKTLDNNENYVFLEQDAADTKVMDKALLDHGVDIVFDLACMPLPTSLTEPRKVIDNNNSIALNLLEAYREGRIDELIHYSTSEVPGSAKIIPMDEEHPLDPMNPYGGGKAGIDMFIKTYNKTFGLKTKIIRPFNNFGPRQNRDAYAGVIPITIRKIFEGEAPILFGTGTQTRDFIYVKDTAEGTVRIAKSKACEGEIVNLARGVEIQIGNLIELIKKEMNCNLDTINKPERVADVRRHFASNAKLKRLIDWVPPTSFEEGIKPTVKWYTKVLSQR